MTVAALIRHMVRHRNARFLLGDNRTSYGPHEEGLSAARNPCGLRHPNKIHRSGFYQRLRMHIGTNEVNLYECFIVTLAKVSYVAICSGTNVVRMLGHGEIANSLPNRTKGI